MTITLEDLHTGIYSILTNDATLMTLASNNIFNHVPQGTVSPYVAIGGFDSLNFLTFDSSGENGIYSISVYDTDKSLIAIYKIVDRIRTLIDGNEQAFCDLGFEMTQIQYRGMSERPDYNMETDGRVIELEFNVLSI